MLNVHECIETQRPPAYDYARADVDAIACALMTHPLNFSTSIGSADDIWCIGPILRTLFPTSSMIFFH